MVIVGGEDIIPPSAESRTLSDGNMFLSRYPLLLMPTSWQLPFHELKFTHRGSWMVQRIAAGRLIDVVPVAWPGKAKKAGAQPAFLQILHPNAINQ